jgi:hypothetical protein
MGILSLCADSARPPGTTMLLEDTDGSCITIGYKFCDKRQCYTAPNLYQVFDSHVTTYYSTQDAFTSSPLHLSSKSSLHVISALTCDIFTLAQRQTRTPLPICNWFEKQWLPPSPMRSNTSDTPFPIYAAMNHHAQTPKSLARALLWLPLTLLLCFILMATFFTSWLRMNRNRKRIQTTRRRQQNTWKYIYDSDTDKVLTWNNKRFVTPKRKNDNTFPRHAQPFQGHWHGSSFIVDHLDNWTKNTPKAIPDTRGTPQRRTEMDNNLKMDAKDNKWHQHTPPLDTHTGKPPHPQATLTNKWNPTSATTWTATTPATTTTKDTTHSDNPKGKQHQQHQQRMQHILRTKQKVKPKLAAKTFTRHPKQNSNNNPRDSHMSSKWHPQERLNLQWTKQHLDAYLALAEVICEWNIEPG